MAACLFFRRPLCCSCSWGAHRDPSQRALSSLSPSAAKAAAQLLRQQQELQQQHWQQQQVLQQQHQQRFFSRFRRSGSLPVTSSSQTLNPKKTSLSSNPKPSQSVNPKTSSQTLTAGTLLTEPGGPTKKTLNRETAIKQQRVSESDTLYDECVAELRRRRYELGDPLEAPSPQIEELEKQEKLIIKTLMQRTEQEAKAAGTGIDAFWDPMARVEGLEAQVAHDFEELTKLVGAAEARRQRLLLRRSLRKAEKLYDPLSDEHAQYFGEKFFVDELTHRVAVKKDLRAEAMLRVLMEKYPKLDYFRFLQLQAKWRQEGRTDNPTPKTQSSFQSLMHKHPLNPKP